MNLEMTYVNFTKTLLSAILLTMFETFYVKKSHHPIKYNIVRT
jgi:hypothetical protein